MTKIKLLNYLNEFVMDVECDKTLAYQNYLSMSIIDYEHSYTRTYKLSNTFDKSQLHTKVKMC